MTTRTSTNLRLSLCAFALASATALAADPLPYTYIDLDFVSVDAGGGTETGLSVDGSFAFNDQFYGVASLSDVDTVTSLSVGAGLRGEVGANIHAFGEVQLLSVDTGGGSDTGFIVGGGLRGTPSERLELFGRIDHVDIGNGSDQGLTVGAIYYFDRIGVGAQFSSNDNTDGVAIGVRFTF